MKVTFIITGFLSGVIYHSLFQNSYFEIPWFFLVLSLFFLLSFLSSYFKYLLIFLIGFSIGWFRFHISLPSDQELILDSFVEDRQEVSLYGTIISEPEYGADSLSFVFKAQEIEVGTDTYDISTKINVRTHAYQQLNYGDYIFISGIPEQPEPFESYGGRTFHYENYLAKDGIFYVMNRVKVEILSNNNLPLTIKIIRSLYRFKEKLVDQGNNILPQPESGLLAGILYGKEDALYDDMNEAFRRVGLMHIVVLSGYNVSLVIHLVMKILSFLPIKIKSSLAVLGIISFALLVGAGPTVIRASIMALFIVFAGVIGRKYDVIRALMIAGIIMILINPWILIFDISFQLSFLATYGLLVSSPIFEYFLRKIPNTLELRDSLIATLSAQTLVTPLILYTIGDFSIVSPVVNAMVLFAVPWGMLLGFLASLPGLSFLSVVAYLPLKYITSMVTLFSELSFAVVTVRKFNIILMFILYFIIIYLIYRGLKYIRKKQNP